MHIYAVFDFALCRRFVVIFLYKIRLSRCSFLVLPPYFKVRFLSVRSLFDLRFIAFATVRTQNAVRANIEQASAGFGNSATAQLIRLPTDPLDTSIRSWHSLLVSLPLATLFLKQGKNSTARLCGALFRQRIAYKNDTEWFLISVC